MPWGATSLLSLAYGYDALGLVTQQDETGAASKIYAYDPLRQVIAAGTASAPESYSYDAEGNRITSHLSSAHIADSANQLLEDDAACYGYDASGNRISKTEKIAGSCAGDVTAYHHDSFNRLVGADLPDGTAIAYRHDAIGRRIEKEVAGSITRRLHDGEDILIEFDGGGGIQARYSHGQGIDQPLVMERGGQSYFYHAERLGSIRQLSDAAGLVVNAYDYDAYGRFTARSETLANPYGFTAREYDHETGLYHYRARAYDPQTGRFLQDDPIKFRGRDLNLQRYVHNNPVNATDPFGLAAAAEYGGTVSRGAGLAGSLVALRNAINATFFAVAAILAATSAADDDDGRGSGSGGGSGRGSGSGGGSGAGAGQGSSAGSAGDGASSSGSQDPANPAGTAGGGEANPSGEGPINPEDPNAPFGRTPDGRPLTKHYGTETGPQRNIPGSVVDEVVNNSEGVPAEGGKTVHYDPENNVTVVTGDNGAIVSAHKGPPRAGQM